MKIKYADFQQTTRSRSQQTVVMTHEHLRRASLDLVRSVFLPAKGIRLVGVTVSDFADVADAPGEQLPIFAHASAA